MLEDGCYTMVATKAADITISRKTLVDENLSRGERRKYKTRFALIDAARELVQQQGYDQVTIQQMTDAADVGLGTFYNYFDSKTAIFEAILDDLNGQFFDELDTRQQGVDDPAARFVLTIRHCLQAIIDDSAWAWFMVHSNLVGDSFMDRNATRMIHEIESAAQAGRFKVDDARFALMMLKGMSTSISSSEAFGYPLTDELIEKSLCYLLRMLGMEDGEAKQLAVFH